VTDQERIDRFNMWYFHHHWMWSTVEQKYILVEEPEDGREIMLDELPETGMS